MLNNIELNLVGAVFNLKCLSIGELCSCLRWPLPAQIYMSDITHLFTPLLFHLHQHHLVAFAIQATEGN
jgi:hypothetical protein